MREVGVLEAKTTFSSIVAEVERTGEDVIVTRYGKPAVRISSAVSKPRLTQAERAELVRQMIADRDRQPPVEPFDLREALGRDRGEEWS